MPRWRLSKPAFPGVECLQYMPVRQGRRRRGSKREHHAVGNWNMRIILPQPTKILYKTQVYSRYITVFRVAFFMNHLGSAPCQLPHCIRQCHVLPALMYGAKPGPTAGAVQGCPPILPKVLPYCRSARPSKPVPERWRIIRTVRQKHVPSMSYVTAATAT